MADEIKLPKPVAYCLGSPHFADSSNLYLAARDAGVPVQAARLPVLRFRGSK